MQFLNKIFYVHLINAKVRRCLLIFSKDWQNYNRLKILNHNSQADMFLNIFYRENKYKMKFLFFCRWIGKVIMKFLPECNFFNLSKNRQTMPNFSIDKMYIKYFVQILHVCTSSLSFLESFCWNSSKCPAANL